MKKVGFLCDIVDFETKVRRIKADSKYHDGSLYPIEFETPEHYFIKSEQGVSKFREGELYYTMEVDN